MDLDRNLFLNLKKDIATTAFKLIYGIFLIILSRFID